MAKKLIGGVALAASTGLLLAGCAGGAESGGDPDAIAGDLTVLTNRTDIVDTVFQDYKEQFEEEYPDVNVTFEAITDYEGEVTTRMNTDDYGDVLLIPNSIAKDELPTYFEPLGTVDELGEEYRFVREQSYEGDVYGIAITGNASGVVVNTAVWEEAGITAPPTTPEEFVDGLEAIAENTDATPLYTNYKDGWPLSQWEGNQGTPTGNPDAPIRYTEIDDPWAEGEDHYIIDSILFDAVAEGLTEEDPLTTNWEESKGLIGSGQVGAMVLGSWAIVQMQDAAEAAGGSADDIDYWPFPNQVDGAFHSTIGGDYKNGINVNSDNKAAARAWIDWFADESGYATDQGGLAPRLDGPTPDTLATFDELGVEYIELTPAPEGQESLLTDIYNTAEIDLWGNLYRQKLIDIARGAADGDKESYFDELNTKWAEARAEVAR
jgi:ABC-type glycerol-3-phosphate transport system substrate-binding protein